MKIAPLFYPQVKYDNSHNLKNRNFAMPVDTFTKSTPAKSPNFGQKIPMQKFAQEILENPQTKQKYLAWITEAFALVTAMATGKTAKSVFNSFYEENAPETEEDKINNDIGDDEIRIVSEKTYTPSMNDTIRTDKYEDINDIGDDEIRVIGEDIEENPDIASSDGEKTDYHEQTEDSSIKPFVFPKKRGHYAEGHLLLKSAAEQLSLPPEEYEKLTAICTAVNKKSVTDTEGNIRPGYAAAMEIALELKKEGADITQVINNYYNKLGLEISDSPETVTTKTDKENVTVTEVQDDNTSLSEIRKNRGKCPTVLGKVDLDSIEKKPRQRIKHESPTESPAVSAEDNGVFSATIENTCERTPAEQTDTVFEDANRQSYRYIAEGTVKHPYEGIKKMVAVYQRAVYSAKKDPGFVAWATRTRRAYDVTVHDVDSELFRHQGISGFENINEDNAGIIAEIISDDRRFGKYFTIHGAMRCIDRYADFNSSESLSEQCREMLDCLENVIKTGLKKQVNILKVTSDIDKKGNTYYCMQVTFNNEFFNDKERKFFGSKPLVIVLGEYREGTYEKDFRKKQPLIFTIYPDKY